MTANPDCVPPDLAPETSDHEHEVILYQRPARDLDEGMSTTATVDRPEGDARLSPASRHYGESYPATQTLDLPQLAVWIMAGLIAYAADPDCGLAPELRYGALVNPIRRELRLIVFGMAEDQREENPESTSGLVMRLLASPVVHAHNWTNPADYRDDRFIYTVTAPDRRHQRRERARRRGPGTVTVIDIDDPSWWR